MKKSPTKMTEVKSLLRLKYNMYKCIQDSVEAS